MLAKLKRRSDRFGKALRRVFRSPSPPPPEVIPEYTDWHGLKALVDLLNDKPNGFEPLKATIESLSTCVDKFEGDARTRLEYAKIGTDMNDLFTNLARHIATTPPHTTAAESMMNICRSVAYQIDPLLVENTGGDATEAGETIARKNTSQVLWAYRQVRTLLALFLMSENTRLWRLEVDRGATVSMDSLLHCPEAHYRHMIPDAIPRNGCLENTRVAVLQDLQHWVHYGKRQHVFWLNGTAGTGKTAVAYSLCEYLENSGKLSASFFCSREHAGCQDVNRIVPSICYQLAQQSRPFRSALLSTLHESQDTRARLIREQFEALITVPLRKAGHTFAIDAVVVIDDVEQCDDADGVRLLLQTIIEHAPQLPIKFLLSVRPTRMMQQRIVATRGERRLFELRLHEVDQSVVREDIKTYLLSKLNPLNLPATTLETLTQRPGVLFAYAETLIKHVGQDDRLNGLENRRAFLQIPDSDIESENYKGPLNEPELQGIIDGIASEDSTGEAMKMVLRTAIHIHELPATSIAYELLRPGDRHTAQDAVDLLLMSLLASEAHGNTMSFDGGPVKYLMNRSLSGRFYHDAQHFHQRLAHTCFDLISSARPGFNICGLESSYLLDREIPNVRERMDDAISPELRYACLHWGVHLVRSGRSNDLLSKLRAFMSERLLLWVEILNLKHQILRGIDILDDVHAWLKACTYAQGKIAESEEIEQLVQDASAFLTDIAASPITESTPHIYVSGLQIMRPFGPVLGQYLAKIKRLAIRNDTNAPQGHTDYVRSVAYSPDGAHIVSGSYDDTSRIWDAHTGQPVGQPLTGHTDRVRSVAYSPDGAYTASGSDDKTIRIWDAHTGKPVGQPLTGHTEWVRSVAYSPDSAYIVSGSYDDTIRIWDAHTGKPVGQPLTGHTNWVNSVAYSPDGAYIASGSSDESIRIWDAHTCKPVGQPLTGHTSYVLSVAYSPDGAYIVSGSGDKTIRNWDAHSGQPIGQPLTGHTGDVNSVTYSPDGACIASGSDDHTIRIWDAHTGKPVGQPLTGHTHWVWSVAYSPDGAYIVSGSDDHTIRTWFAPTLQEQARLQAPTESTHLTQSNSPNRSNPSFAVAKLVTRNRKPKPIPTIGKLPTQPASHFSLERPVPPITSTPFDWTLNDDGWVVGPSRERLVWIPSELRSALTPPNIKAILSTKPSLSLDFHDAKLGTEWEQCYEPR